jgi:hypothetical protein
MKQADLTTCTRKHASADVNGFFFVATVR